MIKDTEHDEDLQLFDVMMAGSKIQSAGISASGEVYLRGDIHPLGSFAALIQANKHGVPYVAVNAVEVLYPASWLRAECLGDLDRLRIIVNAEDMVRSAHA